MSTLTRVEKVLPARCHPTIGNSSIARDLIQIERGQLIFPDNDPGRPIHLMGHQSGTQVRDATDEQLKALLAGGAREAAKLLVPANTFAGAILAGGRIMGEQESSKFRQILSDFRDNSNLAIEELAPMFGATLSVLDSTEVTSALNELIREQREELLKSDSTLRPWILAACPYRAMLHEVYKAALESDKIDEIAWTVARLQGMKQAVATSQGDTKRVLIDWAQFFADELDYMITNGLVDAKVTDPLQGKEISVQSFARELRGLK